MIRSNNLRWEPVIDVSDGGAFTGRTLRAAVPGGWIYRIVEGLPVEHDGQLQYGMAWTNSLCFVPHP